MKRRGEGMVNDKGVGKGRGEDDVERAGDGRENREKVWVTG